MMLMVDKDKDVSFAGAGGVSNEAVANIRTVASFGLESRLVVLFNNALGDGSKQANKCVRSCACACVCVRWRDRCARC
jgi:hypothetical protein